MKIGLFITNQYIKSDKFTVLYDMFTEAARKTGCVLQRMTNAEVWYALLSDSVQDGFSGIDFVLFWDKDLLLARYLEKRGLRLFNSAHAIEVCDDKGLTFVELFKSGLSVPKTFISPKVFSEFGEDIDYFERIAERLGFPLVIKENRGSFGLQVYLIKDRCTYLETVRALRSKPFLIQEFVTSSYGKDIRIQVVGQEAVASVLRSNPDDFRANVTNGGSMTPYRPTKEEQEMAIRACELLRLDFAGVDILFGNHGEPVLCEVNSNAHLVNLYHCTAINAAERILAYIIHSL